MSGTADRRAEGPGAALRLYAHPLSSYSQKVLIALHENATPFEWRLLSSQDPSAGAEFGALWPIGRFPALRAGGELVVESSVIIEWLDLNRPGPTRFVPAEPREALRVRALDRIFDQYVMTPMQAIVFDRIRPEGERDPHGVASAHALLDRACAWLDGELTGRRWAAGDAFGLADCAAAPALFYADCVHPLRDRRHLASYLDRLCERPSFARAVDEARPYRHLFPGTIPPDR